MKPSSYLGIDLEIRAHRRLLAIGMYAGYALMVAAFWAAGHVSKPLLALAIPSFLVMAFSYYGLSLAVRAYCFTESKDAVPRADERQAQVRDRSFVASYQILAFLVSFSLVYLLVAPDFHWFVPNASSLQAVFWFALLFTATLPSVWVAWNEPGTNDVLDGQPAGEYPRPARR